VVVKIRRKSGRSSQPPGPRQANTNASAGTAKGNTSRVKQTGACPACGNETTLDVTPAAYGRWFIGCYSCEAEGVTLGDLLRALATAVGAPDGGSIKAEPHRWLGDYLDSAATMGGVEAVPDEALRREWAVNLMLTPRPRRYLTRERGLTKRTLRRAGIGWDRDRACFTIPIRDAAGQIVNLVRRPLPHVDGPKYKMLAGRGIPERRQLYPRPLPEGPILAVGGLLDALLGRQHGLPTVSGTHGIGTSLDVWLPVVRGREVAAMWDVGEENAMTQRVAALAAAGAYAWPVRLSRLLTEGKDLTDALTGGYTADDITALMRAERRRAGL
jgi:hypothetical protein